MREIELKFRVDNLENVIDNLKNKGCSIGDYVIQNDTIYVEDLGKLESKEGTVWLRVRKLNDKCELNYKKQAAKKSESQEIEFEVSDYVKANEFLKALGYKEWVVVNKRRRYSEYREANICIDEVERLGSFVEVEFLIDENDSSEEYEEKLFEIAKDIGIDIKNRIEGHYDTMIWNLGE